MPYDLDLLARTPALAELAEGERDMMMASRLWVVLRKLGRDPTPCVAGKLGGERRARRLSLLMEEVAAAWPEPFRVNPPCCGRLSPDEALLGRMIRHAAAGDQPGFDRLTCEMIAADQRALLFSAARRLVLAPYEAAGC